MAHMNMMSQKTITDTIDHHIAKMHIEEFFDEHPFSFNVERFRLSDNIVLFLDLQTPETYLVEIYFKHFKEAIRMSKQFEYILKEINSKIDLFRVRNKLFLRRLLY